MSRRQQLSELQIAILRVLWEAGEATIAEVHQALEPERGLAPTTVATLLSRLARRGVVRRRTDARHFVYRAAVEEREVRRSMVGELTRRLFDGDPSALVHHLIDEGEIDAEELARLRALLARRRGKRGTDGDGHGR